MEKAIQGKKIKLMFRLTRERATTAAKLLALEISHEYKSETKTDTQSTKRRECSYLRNAVSFHRNGIFTDRHRNLQHVEICVS